MPIAPDLAGAALDGRYELHALIGEGTFGRVYRGIDRRLRRPVAIKVIKPWWGEDPEWAERFEREAQLLARVSDPGIVQIFDVGQCDEGLYYVAELVHGESLAQQLHQGPLPVARAVAIAEQLCRALAHTHACGVIHRDIKPANVLVGAGGQVKLSDFSIARLAEGSSEGQATIAGTPKYMAPEQARGLPATPATDLYSVGVVLYEMLAGHPPFAAGTAVDLALRHLQEPPAPLGDHVPTALSAVVMRALEKEPERRFATAAAMAGALAQARRGQTLSATAAPTPRLPPTTAAPSPARTAATAAPARKRHAVPAPPRRAAGPNGTQVGGPGPRRNANPSARRRTAALLVFVAALVLAMLATARLLSAGGRVRVPDAIGLTRAAAASELHHAGLTPAFTSRYGAAPAGTAIAQAPGARRQVAHGSRVDVVLSAGLAPVRVPSVTGTDVASATATLRALGLHAAVRHVPAPGIAAGTVIAQSPAAGNQIAAHSTVTVSVAQSPRWRTVTAFSGTDAGASPVFQIQGAQWRVIYRMRYVGTCTLIIFCSGPSAHVSDLSSGQTSDFDLNTGSGQAQTLNSGPGSYRIDVRAGSDTASWSIEVQDYF